MANFSYETYKAQAETKRKNNAEKSQGNQNRVHFFGEWLRNDGDTIIVRFPYHSMHDIDSFVSTHNVLFPGDKYEKKVQCADHDCPLCKQGVKMHMRVMIKGIVYITDPATGKVTLTPAIWDRPSAFADIELKEKMEEYGDLTNCLFKLKRFGQGTGTRYQLNVITNTAVYNPEIYKADFSALDEIDPVRITVRPLERYLEAIQQSDNPDTEEEAAATPTKSAFTVSTPAAAEPAPAEGVTPAPAVNPQPAEEEKPQQPRIRKYTF